MTEFKAVPGYGIQCVVSDIGDVVTCSNQQEALKSNNNNGACTLERADNSMMTEDLKLASNSSIEH